MLVLDGAQDALGGPVDGGREGALGVPPPAFEERGEEGERERVLLLLLLPRGSGGKRSGGGPPAVQWYRASDTSVSPVSEGGLMACEAYLLLYARRDEDDI